MKRGNDEDASPSEIDVSPSNGTLTKANCDAVRDAALECSGSTAGMAKYFLGNYSDDWAEDSEYGKSLCARLNDCIDQFEKAWTREVADFFIVYRPEPSRRFGFTSDAVLTACEYAYWQACTGKLIIRSLKKGPETTRSMIRAWYGLNDDSSIPYEVASADIQAEWAAAVRALQLIHRVPPLHIQEVSIGTPASTKRQIKLDAALAYIRKSGPVCGAAVAAYIKIDESTFRKHYVPALKSQGVLNNGDGYFLPDGAT